MRVLFMLLLTSVAAPAIAGSSLCGVAPVGVHRSGFETGEVAPPAYNPQPSLPSDATPLVLAVHFPTEGVEVGTPTIQVYGAFAGPPNTGVSVNEVPAIQGGTAFLGRSVALEPGFNEIEVRATTSTGATQSIVRTVNYNPDLAPDVQLSSAHAGTYAPFSMRFTVGLRSGLANPEITRIRIDFNGDGTFDVDTTDPSERLSYRYQSPGLYVANAEVTLDDGNPVTPPVVVPAMHRVLGEDLDVTRATLCKAFETHRSNLAAQQYTAALQVFNADVRPDYQGFIEGLGTNGATVASGLGEIVDGAIGQEFAELKLARPIAGQPGRFHGFPLQFSRDSDGVWRISAL
jgi:hypothetical protein